MSESAPSFVTQVKRKDQNVNSEQTQEDDSGEEGCCPCLFGRKKAKKPQTNTRTNNDAKPSNNQGTPTISKLSITPTADPDRDKIGLNSPRGRDDHRNFPSSQQQSGLLPPQKPGKEGRKCMVLDLDETLVHSSFQPVAKYDFLIPVEIDGTTYQVYVAKRPHVDQFLLEMGKLYEIVIFTASMSKYANPVLDLLDIHKVIDFRLFREHCTYTNDIYVKDMTKMGRPITEVFIIDNSPNAYAFQPENAVPCRTWFDDYDDKQLLKFIPILTPIADPSCKNVIAELARLGINGICEDNSNKDDG